MPVVKWTGPDGVLLEGSSAQLFVGLTNDLVSGFCFRTNGIIPLFSSDLLPLSRLKQHTP